MTDKRYCSHCGKKLRTTGIDVSRCTNERIYCRRCRRFVWVNDDNKYDGSEQLLESKLKKKEKVRSLPKVVRIRRRFCQYCKAKIDYTVADWLLFSYLECPKCGEITFYEDVVRGKCLSCKNYRRSELGTFDKCKDPARKNGYEHMNEAECTSYQALT